MATRIRRSRTVDRTDEVEELMKSISTAQALVDQHAAEVKVAMPKLFAAMKSAGMSSHRVDDIIAEISRSAGRATNVVDPKAFRKHVKDDAEFFSAISVSITRAKEILPKKTLDTITSSIPGKAGDETVKVSKWTEKK